MRRKSEIDRDMKASIHEMDLLVDESVKSEQGFDERQETLTTYIKALKKEKPYEETLKGQLDKRVAEVKKEVRILFDELEQETGVALRVVSSSQHFAFMPWRQLKSR